MTEQKKDSTSDSAPMPRTEATYVVQVSAPNPTVPEAVASWKDVAELSVPVRTHRKTVLDKVKAEVELGLEPGDTAQLRVIPIEHAKSETVTMEQPPPQLRIGT